ncbi:MAG: hypothetical protein ACKVWR_13325 [Acidimicrobiales bacterium]
MGRLGGRRLVWRQRFDAAERAYERRLRRLPDGPDTAPRRALAYLALLQTHVDWALEQEAAGAEAEVGELTAAMTDVALRVAGPALRGAPIGPWARAAADVYAGDAQGAAALLLYCSALVRTVEAARQGNRRLLEGLPEAAWPLEEMIGAVLEGRGRDELAAWRDALHALAGFAGRLAAELPAPSGAGSGSASGSARLTRPDPDALADSLMVILAPAV